MSDWPSIEILEKRVRGWMTDHGNEPVRFAGQWTTQYGQSGESSEPAKNIVLFGDALQALSKGSAWSEKSFRFWVLSESVRTTLKNIFGLPSSAIGVIPRDELFPMKVRCSAFPQVGEFWTLVYAGRLTSRKNILFLIRMASQLQIEFNENVKLVLIGRGSEAFVRKVKDLIAALPWREPPELRPPVAPSQWTRLNFRRPVFISLSLEHTEDFGVSLAQAQSAGWPAIVSAWGGHLEATSRNVIQVSPLHLWVQDATLQASFSQTVAAQIFKRRLVRRRLPTSKRTAKKVRTISRGGLRKVLSSWRGEVIDCGDHKGFDRSNSTRFRQNFGLKFSREAKKVALITSLEANQRQASCKSQKIALSAWGRWPQLDRHGEVQVCHFRRLEDPVLMDEICRADVAVFETFDLRSVTALARARFAGSIFFHWRNDSSLDFKTIRKLFDVFKGGVTLIFDNAGRLKSFRREHKSYVGKIKLYDWSKRTPQALHALMCSRD